MSHQVPCESRTRLSSLEGWRLAARPRAQQQRKERESNPQGSSLDRFRDGCHHPLACPSVFANNCGGRNRTCVRALNRRLPVPARAPPQSSRRSWIRTRAPTGHGGPVGPPAPEAGGLARLSHTPIARAPSGNRTRTSAMARQQATATSWVPFEGWPNCQRSRAPDHGVPRCPDSNPTSPHYGCGILAARATSANVLSVGREGLEASPTWLRARHAAASTLIPFVCSSMCFPLSARTVGAEGVEPSTWSL
jgi:hypothetical protein